MACQNIKTLKINKQQWIAAIKSVRIRTVPACKQTEENVKATKNKN